MKYKVTNYSYRIQLIKIIDYKIILKLQCKTTLNPVFVGKKIIKIEQESTLE
jgi:hypothetical protein